MRLALVTGGSKGLGRALCQKFCDEGFDVLEFSRSAPHDYSIELDLSLPEESLEIAKPAIASYREQQLEELLVINNAGTLHPIGPATLKSRTDLLANININFVSAILMLTEIVSCFKSSQCRKVLANISSGAALKGYAGWSSYCAAKAGMENFIRAIAIEQQSEEYPFIPINIDPGVVDTDMQAGIRQASIDDFPELDRFVQRKIDGALESPENVASAIFRILSLRSLNSGGRYTTDEYLK